MHNEFYHSDSILIKLRAQIRISTMYEHKIDTLCLDAARSKIEAEKRINLQKNRINLDLQLMSNTIDVECMDVTKRIRSLALSAENDTKDIERIENRMARDKNSILFFKSLHTHTYTHGFMYPEPDQDIAVESEETEWLWLARFPIYEMCFLYGIGIIIHEKFQR